MSKCQCFAPNLHWRPFVMTHQTFSECAIRARFSSFDGGLDARQSLGPFEVHTKYCTVSFVGFGRTPLNLGEWGLVNLYRDGFHSAGSCLHATANAQRAYKAPTLPSLPTLTISSAGPAFPFSLPNQPLVSSKTPKPSSSPRFWQEHGPRSRTRSLTAFAT